ncbi:MAG: PEGA domain-containing protein [Deltaproteobacteria bacterium]|nr:PEGA domain-containing protein [Deltaproteobacteria bacterium]
MTKRVPCRSWFGFLASALCFGLPPAEAQTDAEVEAQRLFESGVAASTAGDAAGAAEAFERSHALFPHPGTLKNLAASLETAGRAAESWRAWNELLDRYGAVISEAARAEAQARAAALDQRLARVVVTSNPAGAQLEVDDRPAGTASPDAPLRLEPGEHRFTARLEGREAATRTANLAAGDNPPLAFELPFAVASFGTLRVESPTAGATATIDGGSAEALPLSCELEAGEHEVRLEAPGHLARVERVLIEPGTPVRLELEVETATPTTPGGEGGGFWDGPWPWVIGGVLAAGLAGGITAGVLLAPGEPVAGDWRVRMP